MYRRSTPSLPLLPQLHRLSLRAASTAAPGEYPPTLRDIVELELLLQRLFELKETDDDGNVILSDEDQLHRMLFSLKVFYAEVADEPRPPGGPLMTDQDVNALTNIVFELGVAREEARGTGRSFFLTTGAYTRMLEVLEQLAPGQRGVQARAVADQRLQDRLDREEQERLQREAEERRRREAEAEERRRREAEAAAEAWVAARKAAVERRRREAEAAPERRVRPRIIHDDDDDDEPFKAHPAAVVGWNDFVVTMGEIYFVTLSENPNPSRARAIARELADAQLREGGLPLARSAEVLATRLIEARLVDFRMDDVAAFNRLKAILLKMAWEAVGNAVRRDLDFAAATMVLHAAVELGEINDDVGGEINLEEAPDNALINWLLMGGHMHRDRRFLIVAQGLAAAATNDAANDAAVTELEPRAPLSYPPPRSPEEQRELLQLGRQLLINRYLFELQTARRELVARQNTPIRDDGAGPSGVHDGSAAAADDNDMDDEDDDDDDDEEDEEEEPVRRRWNYGGYLRGLDGALR